MGSAPPKTRKLRRHWQYVIGSDALHTRPSLLQALSDRVAQCIHKHLSTKGFGTSYTDWTSKPDSCRFCFGLALAGSPCEWTQESGSTRRSAFYCQHCREADLVAEWTLLRTNFHSAQQLSANDVRFTIPRTQLTRRRTTAAKFIQRSTQRRHKRGARLKTHLANPHLETATKRMLYSTRQSFRVVLLTPLALSCEERRWYL